MAEIEFRLPSAIPYAYVNWRGTEEEAARLNPEMLAALYANTLNAFQQAEREAGRAIATGANKLEDLPADEPEGMTTEAPTPMEIKEEAVAEEAAMADEIIKQGLGATEIDDVNAPPYKQPAPEAQEKPWEAKKPAPKVEINVDGW